MIHYDLRCDADHAFDGWFRDSASFDKQATSGLLSCPTCASIKVGRALMAPAVTKSRRREMAPVATTPATQPPPSRQVAIDPARLPDQVRVALQRIRAEVEKQCDYVGPSFADEARKMHRGDIDPRGIYGETTPEQAEMLADEGIEIARIPWVPPADA